jgi:hypothetical protein
MESTSSIRVLGISHNDMGSDGVRSLLSSLSGNGTVSTLDLSANFLGKGTGKLLRNLLKVNSTLTSLATHRNDLHSRHEAKITAMLEDHSSSRCGVRLSPRLLLFPVHFGKVVDLRTHLVLSNTSKQPYSFHITPSDPSAQIVFPSMGFVYSHTGCGGRSR